MKKIFSLSLVGLMMFSMIPTAFAADVGGNWSGGTAVVYGDDVDEINGGAGTEAYTVTVPAKMNPNQTVTGGVSAEGTLPATKKLVVTASDSVVLTCGNNSKTLTITGGDLVMNGSNIEAVSAAVDIAVSDFAVGDAPLFGEWSGTITYTAAIENIA